MSKIVDVSALKKGDRVLFRGYEALGEISNVELRRGGRLWVYFEKDFNGENDFWSFSSSGRWADGDDSAQDIIEVFPALEPTQELKDLMAGNGPLEDPPLLYTETEDVVNNPNHYLSGGIELIDVLEAKHSPEEVRGGCKFQIHQYVFRSPHKKNELEDLKKAQWWINRLIAYIEKEKNGS